jgi:hypothetical protein
VVMAGLHDRNQSRRFVQYDHVNLNDWSPAG